MGVASKFHSYVDTVDVGNNALVVGPGEDTEDIEYFSNRTTTTSLGPGASLGGSRHIDACLEDIDTDDKYSTIWATHVLEHSRNPGIFLDKCYQLLEPRGNLFIAVPPRKDAIVGGHMTLWNMGLLWYHLILAGFDVRHGYYDTAKYNLFAHVRRPFLEIVLPKLRYDKPDIDTLAKYNLWPEGYDIEHGFNGASVID